MTRSLNSNFEEVSYDSNIGMGLMLENLPAKGSDPFEALVELEEHLMEVHGVSLLQAARIGYRCMCHG